MEFAEDKKTPQALVFGRHIVGMMFVAAANPLIYYGSEKLTEWAFTWFVPLIFASVLYGLYALFLTEHARAAWPRSFFTLAWVLLLLSVASPWVDRFNDKQKPTPQTSQAATERQAGNQQQDEAIDWEKGVITPPSR